MKKTILSLFLVCPLNACNSDKKEELSSKQVSAVLKSSTLNSIALKLTESATLTNVTGLADSIGLNFSQSDSGNTCGFNVWSADSQTTRSGLEGRTYEQFDLGDPVSWTSLGAGLQGECESAIVSQVESYFMYIDLHIAVNGKNKIIRVYMGQQAPFEAGDIVLKNGAILSWYDTDQDILVVSSEKRPTNPATVDLGKEIPWYDNNGSEKIIMMEFRIDTDKNDYSVTKNTGHIIVDVDFANSGIQVTDTSDDKSILKTLSLPFLDASKGGSGLLKASLKISDNRTSLDQ
ncbi:MAG: hypothetical protein R3B45_11445 [Bdellovibrionota bacterium]